MTNWYEVTAKYVTKGENGLDKKVSEKYLVSAVCVADAERTVMAEIGEFAEELDIKSAVQKDIVEVFRRENRDKWYKGKLMVVTIDEKSGKEKKTAIYVMVEANDLQDAVDGIRDGMKTSMLDWEFNMVQETAVVDVFN